MAIPVYIINLARRSDRMERIDANLHPQGISYQRVDAVDANTISLSELDRETPKTTRLGDMGRGDRCCLLSHLRAWQCFLDTTHDFALFVEDDAYFSSDLAPLLASTDWIPENIDVIKLEKFNEGPSTVLLGPPIGELPIARRLRRLYSRHTGGAAYILSRKAAQNAVERRYELNLPVDHLWFNPNISPFARQYPPYIIDPPMATQRAHGYNSDIAGHARAISITKGKRLVRSLRRALYEINRLPQQVMTLITGGARPCKIEFTEHANSQKRH